MRTAEIVDLTDLEWPVSLLRFNDTLRSRPPGSIFEVRIRDPRIVERVKMIVRNSDCRITRIDRVDDFFRLSIRNSGSQHPEERVRR